MFFLYFSTVAWDEAGGAHNPTQISRALARLGHPVLFIEPQLSQDRAVASLPITVVALTELGMTPLQLKRSWFGLDSGDLENVAENLRRHVRAFGSNTPRWAIYAAPFEPYVRLVPVLRAQSLGIAYYAMDDFAAAPALGYTQFSPAAEAHLVEQADMLAGVTPRVAQVLERMGKHAHVIPNGIDPEFYANLKRRRSAVLSSRLERGEITVGFWGTVMDSMVNAELIAHVARSRPRWVIHLLGAVDPEPGRPSVAARLREFKNVILHGAVPHTDLPRYARDFDVCIAPFPDNAFTRGRDPIKVYEYLAAHKPVIAMHTPQLSALPYVTVTGTFDEFVGAIELAARTPIDVGRVDRFLEAQSWDNRVKALLGALSATPFALASSRDELLPSLARTDMEAWMNYANALEQELGEVQTWARDLEAQVYSGYPQWRTRLTHALRRRMSRVTPKEPLA